MRIYRSKTFTAVPPGMTIKEVIEDHHMTQKELAARLGLSEKHISKLINGEVPLTQDVAIRLERVLDIEASFWNGLEAAYREAILKVEYENSIDEEINFAKPFGYAKLARLGIVPETKKVAEQVNNLQKFFEVASLKNVANDMVMPLVYENIKDMEPVKKSAIYTLVQITKGQARFVEVNPYDAELLRKFIPKIKDLSSEPLIGVKEPLIGVKEPLKDMLAACGVIIVYLPIIDNITSTCITYSKGNSIVLGIPTEDSDAFWNLLEEALHNLVERDFPHSNRKYRNNDPVTVVNY